MLLSTVFDTTRGLIRADQVQELYVPIFAKQELLCSRPFQFYLSYEHLGNIYLTHPNKFILTSNNNECISGFTLAPYMHFFWRGLFCPWLPSTLSLHLSISARNAESTSVTEIAVGEVRDTSKECLDTPSLRVCCYANSLPLTRPYLSPLDVLSQ